ncbi:MAG TPA: PQQ-binding-like beta-propeller repeat protein [Acidimicrobiales bacterium]|jgi:outer membrane protein assembly factor BamB|nr:PQQ-binding-like beta-propeller repeat protein [Acidimicrobiales bacterium]
MSINRRKRNLFVASAALVAAAAGMPSAHATSAAFVNWPGYLGGPAHDGYQKAAKAITPANAASLTSAWSDSIGVLSTPAVYNGVVYVGGSSGNFYALNEATGATIWSDTIGTVKGTTCGGRGFASSATVAPAPGTGAITVYVASPTGYMYAFDAATGAVDWQTVIDIPSTTQNDYFDWSSPAVANGKVYVGVSSQCDQPLVRAGAMSFDQATGKHLATYFSVPAGSVGGSVWSSPAVDAAGHVWVTTGNGPSTNQLLADSDSIVELSGTTMRKLARYQIPNPHGTDSDFGASPTLFSAVLPGQTTTTRLVGACNKNGEYYVLNRDHPAAGPVWTKVIGAPSANGTPDECIEAANYDGKHLFMAGPEVTLGGVSYLGSVMELDPATGNTIWQSGVDGVTDGSSTLSGGGLVSVATFDIKSGTPESADYLFNASTGAAVATIPTGSPQYATPVFADKTLLLGTVSGLSAYTLPSAS